MDEFCTIPFLAGTYQRDALDPSLFLVREHIMRRV